MEKSCGIILFHLEDFLLIQHSVKSNKDEGHWDFPKGHVEDNETELETAIRELEEETGIADFQLVDNFKHRITYNIQNGNAVISKEVIFFLAKSNTKVVTLSSEHQDYSWLSFNSAYDKLTYTNAKETLVKVKTFLEK